MAKGEITAIRSLALRPGDPVTITHKQITFVIDGRDTHVLTLPAEGFTPAVAEAAVQRAVQEWAAVVGKTYEQK